MYGLLDLKYFFLDYKHFKFIKTEEICKSIFGLLGYANLFSIEYGKC